MMSDDISPKLLVRARGRPFEKGRSGNPGGRRRGSRNKATLAAAALLAGESEASTRKAVEMALAGRPPSFIHLGNCPNLGQFVTGLIVGSGGANAAFATASAASGGPCRLRTRARRRL